MKAISLPAYNKNVLRAMLSLKKEEWDSPSLGEDEVLVQMNSATCNPSDIAFIRGEYNIIKALPAIPGFEGSGTVMETGQNVSGLLGKKVSCFVQSQKSGTWAEQFVVNINDLVVLEDNFDMEQAASFSVNPFTAVGLLEIAKIRESKAIVQNAGGGQVAAFVNTLAKDEQIEVINIVRKESTAIRLTEEGFQHVLWETDEQFEAKLKELSIDLKVTTAFDAVGGSLAGMMFNAMLPDSELVSYGGLSGKRISEIDEMDLIFRNKIISGFNLIDWKMEMDQEDFDEINTTLQGLFLSGKLQTRIQGSAGLDDIIQGLKTYIGNMSGGKMLIKPY